MHDERCGPGADLRQTQADPRDLFLKAFAAGRPSARQIAPEPCIGLATGRGEFVMPTAGPVAKVLLAEFVQLQRLEPQRAGRFDGAPRRARIARGVPRQALPQCLQLRPSAEIGRCVGRMDRPRDAIDGRVPYQPEEGLASHAYLQGNWSLWQ